MARPAGIQPTDGELEILNVLWDSGPLELGQLCAALRSERPLATTTVATMLRVMLDKGLVGREQGARGYRWSARLSRRDARKRLVGRLLDRAFDGSAGMLVSHLIDEGKLSPSERKEIMSLLAEAQRRTTTGRADQRREEKP